MFGGAVPDALIDAVPAARHPARRRRRRGRRGPGRREAAPLDYPEDRFRHEAGVLDGVSLIGTGRLVDRIWTKPAISVLGIDAPPTAGGAQRARAGRPGEAVASGIAPGDDPKSAYLALRAHLEQHVPWGAPGQP